MRLEKEFVVGAPLERVWAAVKDPGMFAACVPGADLHRSDDVFAGAVELRANDRQIRCEAMLRAVDFDEDDHVVTMLLRGRQRGGPGIGSAIIQSRCTAADSSTRVLLSAKVSSSGHADPGAQLEAAAQGVLDEAADQLQKRAASAPAPACEPPMAASSLVSKSAAPPVAAGRSALVRPALAGGALAGGAVLGVLLARRLLGGRRR